MAQAFIVSRCVHTQLLAATIVDATFINVSTVCEAIESISFVTRTLKCAWMIDARVVARPFKRAFVNVLTRLLIC